MREVDAGFHVLSFWTSGSFSFFDLRRNGLFEKKPDRFFCTDFSGEVMPGKPTPLIGTCFVGEFLPDIGSALVNELGFEYSLRSSRLLGRSPTDDGAVSARDGPSALQNCVMPSIGY